MEKDQIEATCTYDSDTKRTHRYFIDMGQAITGSLYFPKGSKIPDSVILKLRVKTDEGR
jgi:hypothetical protein